LREAHDPAKEDTRWASKTEQGILYGPSPAEEKGGRTTRILEGKTEDVTQFTKGKEKSINTEAILRTARVLEARREESICRGDWREKEELFPFRERET